MRAQLIAALALLARAHDSEPNGCFYYGFAYSGIAIVDPTAMNRTATDTQLCQDACRTSQECEAFSYSVGGCVLYGAAAALVKADAPSVAGPKVCDDGPPACEVALGEGFPGADVAATNAAFSMGMQPPPLQCWPKMPGSDGLSSKLRNCYATSVQDTGLDGGCTDLRQVTLAEGMSCMQSCVDNVECSVWQLGQDDVCWQGLGHNCKNRTDITPKASQRLVRGAHRVLKDLAGLQVLGLEQAFDKEDFATVEESTVRCKNICLSDVHCQYWQLNTEAGCYVETQAKQLPYPLTSETVQSADASKFVAGEYIMRLCPEGQTKGGGAMNASSSQWGAPIRLVGESSFGGLAGRVEVFQHGRWGTVCDDDFSEPDARVVCRQLGLFGGVAVGQAHFGEGTGPILLDDLQCGGYEGSLSQCGHSGWGRHNCRHQEDAGVCCAATPNAQAVCPMASRPAQVRLVGERSYDGLSGRVEVFHGGRWGTVCDDGFTDQDAMVVCRQMGLFGGVAVDQAYFGEGADPILLDDLQCGGHEGSLSQCGHSGWGRHNCGHHEDVGVCCAATPHARAVCPQSTYCRHNRGCTAQGFQDGSCCPDESGHYRSCCYASGAACLANPGCAGLAGDCCPTSSGAFLGCCSGNSATSANETLPVQHGGTEQPQPLGTAPPLIP